MDLPAACGIKNHGNSCFMNATIQCLSHTDLLAEYLVNGYYKIDLKKRLRLHSKITGSKGELTESFVDLLRSLWYQKYNPELSSKFKHLVAKHGTQYDGYDQHDAQEFLLWLLDKVHEDLNIAEREKSSKKSKKNKALVNHGRPDAELAAESLNNHLKRNNSFIHELFQAQLRSSLICRSCKKESNTFEPFLCLSLPVPSNEMHTTIVNVSYLHRNPREVKVAVTVDSKASLRDLRDRISRVIKVPERQLVLLYLDFENGLRELTKDDQLIIEKLDELQEIFAIETPKCNSNNNHNINDNSSSRNITSRNLTLVFVNRIGTGSQARLFGPIFSCEARRDGSFLTIQNEILESLRPILKTSIHLDKYCNEILFKLRVVGGLPGKCYLPDDIDHPLLMPTVDKAISYCQNEHYRGPVHLMLVVEWNEDKVHKYFIPEDKIPIPVIDPTVAFVRERAQKLNHVSLLDCLDLNFREEKLADDNAWMCPSCEKRQQTVKKLSLWSIPDVLIIHLKRFRSSSNSSRIKLCTPVIFPLHTLDMNPYLVHKVRESRFTSSHRNNSSIHHRDLSLDRQWNSSLPSHLNHPWQRPSLRWSKLTYNDDDNNTYDLYAVCNHIGNMQSGHYTAYCKNPLDQQWYLFDDTKVTQISQSDVVTSDAYILFYQKKSLSTTTTTSLSSSSTSRAFNNSSNSSSCSNHWFYSIDKPITNGRFTMDDIRAYATIPSSRPSKSRFYDLLFKKPSVSSSSTYSTEKERLLSRTPSPPNLLSATRHYEHDQLQQQQLPKSQQQSQSQQQLHGQQSQLQGEQINYPVRVILPPENDNEEWNEKKANSNPTSSTSTSSKSWTVTTV